MTTRQLLSPLGYVVAFAAGLFLTIAAYQAHPAAALPPDTTAVAPCSMFTTHTVPDFTRTDVCVTPTGELRTAPAPLAP